MQILRKKKNAKASQKIGGGVLSAASVKEAWQMPDNGNDRCVCCGGDSGVPHDMPIAKRRNYIQGSGQLCGDCYIDLYIRKSEDEHIVTLDEMHELIRMCKKENREE